MSRQLKRHRPLYRAVPEISRNHSGHFLSDYSSGYRRHLLQKLQTATIGFRPGQYRRFDYRTIPFCLSEYSHRCHHRNLFPSLFPDQLADKQNQITKNNHPFNCKIKLVYKVPGSCGCFFYELLSNEGATLRTLRTNYT